MRKQYFLRSVGSIGTVCAPAMWIDLTVNGLYDRLSYNWTEALFSLIFLIGWIGLTIGFYGIRANGNGWPARLIIAIQVILFGAAACSNILALLGAGQQSPAFRLLDACWPIGQFFLLITGLSIAFSQRIRSWRRWLPFAAGLFFPLALLLSLLPGTHDSYMQHPLWYTSSFGMLSMLTTWGVAAMLVKAGNAMEMHIQPTQTDEPVSRVRS